MSVPVAGRPESIEGVSLVEAYTYLDELRASGVTNMLGARPYVVAAFGCSEEAARQILVAWMEDFGKEAPVRVCEGCGEPMNPAERMLGPVCGKCVRKRHKEVTG